MHYNKLLDTPLLNPIRYYGNKNNNVRFLLSYISTNLPSPFAYLSLNQPFTLRNLLSPPTPQPPWKGNWSGGWMDTYPWAC